MLLCSCMRWNHRNHLKQRKIALTKSKSLPKSEIMWFHSLISKAKTYVCLPTTCFKQSKSNQSWGVWCKDLKQSHKPDPFLQKWTAVSYSAVQSCSILSHYTFWLAATVLKTVRYLFWYYSSNTLNIISWRGCALCNRYFKITLFENWLCHLAINCIMVGHSLYMQFTRPFSFWVWLAKLDLGRGKKIHCFSGKTFPTLEAGGRFFFFFFY